MQRPSHAFGLGFFLFVFLLAIAWIVSGDRIDSVWLSMFWLPLGFGLFLAGVAARRNPLQKHTWIYNTIVLPSLAGAMLTANSWGPIIADALNEHPTITFVLLLNAAVCLYHIAIGIVYLTCDVIFPVRSATR
jgi:hypothetical protein